MRKLDNERWNNNKFIIRVKDITFPKTTLRLPIHLNLYSTILLMKHV